MNTIIRINGVKSRMGYKGNSTVYGYVKDGILTPPIKIGPRASGWIQSEIDSIIDARIAGKSEEEIRKLVKNLTAKRPQTANEILSAT